MQFLRSNHVQILIRLVLSSGLKLVLIASCLAAPTSIILSLTPSSAAPAPFPPAWLVQIGDDLQKNGQLSAADINKLKSLCGVGPGQVGSAKKLAAVKERINQYLSSKGINFELWFNVIAVKSGATFTMKVYIFNWSTAQVVQTIVIGPGKNDMN